MSSVFNNIFQEQARVDQFIEFSQHFDEEIVEYLRGLITEGKITIEPAIIHSRSDEPLNVEHIVENVWNGTMAFDQAERTISLSMFDRYMGTLWDVAGDEELFPYWDHLTTDYINQRVSDLRRAEEAGEAAARITPITDVEENQVTASPPQNETLEMVRPTPGPDDIVDPDYPYDLFDAHTMAQWEILRNQASGGTTVSPSSSTTASQTPAEPPLRINVKTEVKAQWNALTALSEGHAMIHARFRYAAYLHIIPTGDRDLGFMQPQEITEEELDAWTDRTKPPERFNSLIRGRDCWVREIPHADSPIYAFIPKDTLGSEMLLIRDPRKGRDLRGENTRWAIAQLTRQNFYATGPITAEERALINTSADSQYQITQTVANTQQRDQELRQVEVTRTSQLEILERIGDTIYKVEEDGDTFFPAFKIGQRWHRFRTPESYMSHAFPVLYPIPFQDENAQRRARARSKVGEVYDRDAFIAEKKQEVEAWATEERRVINLRHERRMAEATPANTGPLSFLDQVAWEAKGLIFNTPRFAGASSGEVSIEWQSKGGFIMGNKYLIPVDIRMKIALDMQHNAIQSLSLRLPDNALSDGAVHPHCHNVGRGAWRTVCIGQFRHRLKESIFQEKDPEMTLVYLKMFLNVYNPADRQNTIENAMWRYCFELDADRKPIAVINSRELETRLCTTERVQVAGYDYETDQDDGEDDDDE